MNISNFFIFSSGFLGASLLTGYLVYCFCNWFNAKSLSVVPLFKFDIHLTTPQKLLILAIITSLLILAFLNTLLGVFLFLLSVMTWYAKEKGPQLIQRYQKNKTQIQMSDLFPQALGMCIQALKTGQTIPQVLAYLSNECPQPLRSEIAFVCAEMNLGLSAEVSLSKMGERFPDFSEFHQFLESYKIARQTGANLTHLLEVLLEGMEEKNRILRKMSAMTSQARLSGLVMGLLPFLLGLIFFVMDPSLMTPLFTTKGGWGILGLAVILESIGFLWIRQLLRLEI